MTYPRVPDLHRGFSVGFRSNVSTDDARATYVPVRAGELEPLTYEGDASSSLRSFDSWVRLIGVVFSTEGNVAYGFSEEFAIGAWASSELVGAELRLQPLTQREGAPVSATVSLGVAHVGVIPSFSARMLRTGFGARAGIDLGVRLGGVELLLGATASHIRRRRNFQEAPDDGQPSDNLLSGLSSTLMVVRDELKLSVPIGMAIRDDHVAIVFGVVPEWTLKAGLRDVSCTYCSAYRLDSFRQDFALYFTVGAEVWQRAEVSSEP